MTAPYKIVPFVVAVIIQKDKYLLTKRYELDKEDPSDFHDRWQLVGGGIQFGETAQEAIVREVLEEIGIKISIVAIVPFIMNSLRTNWQGHGIVLNLIMRQVNSVGLLLRKFYL